MSEISFLNTYMGQSHVIKEVVNNAVQVSPRLKSWMGRVKPTAGNKTEFNVIVAESDRVQGAGPHFQLGVVDQQYDQLASVPNKPIVSPIDVSKMRIKNIKEGPRANAQVYMKDYLEVQLKVGINALMTSLASDLYGVGTTDTINAHGALVYHFEGFGHMTAQATYGGINPASYPKWKANRMNLAASGTFLGLSLSGTPPTEAQLKDESHMYYLPNLVGIARLACNKGDGTFPDFCWMDRTYYNILHTILKKKQQLPPGKMTEFGYESFMLDGMEVVYDPFCPAGTIDIETSKYCYPTLLGGAIDPGKFDDRKGNTPDTMTAIATAHGAFVCTSLWSQCRITGLSTALSPA